MTEITGHTTSLSPAVERFILHWGDMGGTWGVNRSVSQIHALLYLSDRPLTAEEIAETLSMARSNVSNSIRELMAWNLIHRVPVMGDRRDHFVAETDLWEIVTRIAAGRKAREIDPAAAVLRTCVAEAESDPAISPTAKRRLSEMLEFVETVNGWYEQMLKVPKPQIVSLIGMGARIVRFVGGRGAKDADVSAESPGD
jgi:DNA-binding transcriptional regulator GbsR (MarR family)